MITRRSFMRGVAAGAAMLGFGGRASGEGLAPAPAAALDASGAVAIGPADRVVLGRTGIAVSRLGIGTGTSGWGGRSDQTRLGHDRFVALLRHAMDRGVTYIDAADQYGSHAHVRDALSRFPGRDDVFVLTKTRASTDRGVADDVERFRRELGVDTLGCVLLHCMTRGDWLTRMRPAMDALSEAKAAGKVRSVGVSCHGWAPLAVCRPAPAPEAPADSDWIDVQLVRINPFGTQMDGRPEAVAAELEAWREAGERRRGVLGMKIFGGGGSTAPNQRDQSLRYVLGLGTVDAFTIGFESIEQFDETFDTIQRVGRA